MNKLLSPARLPISPHPHGWCRQMAKSAAGVQPKIGLTAQSVIRVLDYAPWRLHLTINVILYHWTRYGFLQDHWWGDYGKWRNRG